jgi:hypothetical protein
MDLPKKFFDMIYYTKVRFCYGKKEKEMPKRAVKHCGHLLF